MRVTKIINVRTSERRQSCNLLRKGSQPISGNCGLVGAIERCELFQWETRDFDEKIVEVIVVVSVVKGIEIGESFEAAKEGC
jgi:hypothetical protein